MPKIMTVRPPDNLHQKLKQCAKSRGFTLNSLIIQILQGWTNLNLPESKSGFEPKGEKE